MFKTTIKKLQERSDRVLDGFRKALQDYRDINEALNIQIELNMEEIKKAEDNISDLKVIKNENEKFINKLNNFFN
jgi:hypothetical protein